MARTEGTKNRNFPVHSLEKAHVIVRAIVDKGAGRAMDRLLVAQAIGRTPSSSEYKRLLSSSLRYGLTTGTEKADYISPTELGLKIAKPERPDDTTKGLVEACLKPDIMGRIYHHFNRNKLPDTQFLKNTLEKTFAVDASLSEELANLLMKNAKFSGILEDISGSKYIRIEHRASGSVGDVLEDDRQPEPDDSVPELEASEDVVTAMAKPATATTAKLEKPKRLFVGHGKNTKPLEDLKKILGEFGIAYKVAVDEPNAGRPISAKVAALMDECSAGIFIFTRDEQFFREDKDGNREEVWRPSENAVYELGAASILWDKKIIILREDGVNFPSDFSDLGYITFKDGEITNKALDLMKELVALGLVRVQAA